MSSSCDLTQAIAVVIPLNIAADNALRLRANRFLLHDARTFNINKIKGSRRRRHVVARLNHAMLAGRRCILFGSSRATEVRFPPKSGVDPHHFYLKVDADHVVITDVSSSGVWIKQQHAQAFTKLHRASALLHGDVAIKFGKDGCFQVVLRPTISTCAMSLRDDSANSNDI